jgi:hypothetical protein
MARTLLTGDEPQSLLKSELVRTLEVRGEERACRLVESALYLDVRQYFDWRVELVIESATYYDVVWPRSERRVSYDRVAKCLKEQIQKASAELVGSDSCEVEFVILSPKVVNEIQHSRQRVGLGNCFFKTETTITHDELRFRSLAEVALYNELKKRQVLFFPNPAAVLGGTGEKREPDFLICHQGKWGILEVMGETYHTSQNAVKDHGRARLFKQHGLLCIEFYPAVICQSEPARVVDSFLAILGSH